MSPVKRQSDTLIEESSKFDIFVIVLGGEDISSSGGRHALWWLIITDYTSSKYVCTLNRKTLN